MSNLDQVHKMLEGGHSNVPLPQDTEKYVNPLFTAHTLIRSNHVRPKYYVPRNPFQTAPYYPQAPHPALSTHAIFSQLDVETLFYVFYFLPGTYQQLVFLISVQNYEERISVDSLQQRNSSASHGGSMLNT